MARDPVIEFAGLAALGPFRLQVTGLLTKDQTSCVRAPAVATRPLSSAPSSGPTEKGWILRVRAMSGSGCLSSVRLWHSPLGRAGG